MGKFSILLFFASLSATLYASVKPSPELSYEGAITSMKRKIITLENKLLSLESQETVREVKSELTARMEDMRTEFITRNEELNERMNEMYAETKTRQDNITAKLEELIQRTLGQEQDTDEKQSEMERKVEEISKRLQKEIDRFLAMNNHLLSELLQVQNKGDEVSEKIRSVEDEVKSSLEMGRSKMEKLELKGNLTRFLVVSHITSQLDVDEAIRQNATTSVELLSQHVNESVLRLENGQSIIKRKMSNLASLITNVEKVCGNISKLDESLQSIGNEVKQLEQRGDLRSAEASEMQKTLKNHTSQIGAMNSQLFDIQNGCSDPPPITDGYPVVGDGRLLGRKHGALATYACEDGSTLVGSGDVVCRLGEWTGVLPRCAKNYTAQDLKKEYGGLDIPTNTTVEHSKTVDERCRKGYVVSSSSASPTCNDGTSHVTADPCIGGYFDATFYAERYYYSLYIECHSDCYAGEIRFSRVVDTGTGGGLPRGAELSTSEKSARMNLSGAYEWREMFGAYRCGFEAEEGFTYAVVPIPYYADLYFPDLSPAASVGDNITLRLYSSDTSRRVLWRHDGKTITSLEGRTEVDVVNANSGHKGIYSVRYEGETFDRASVHLSVRRCKANMFGERCDQVCPPCYNGGICHDLLGICVCPEGFVGRNCETPCPEGFHGADCSAACGSGDCRSRLFCKPPPNGCSCAPGFKGYFCQEDCEPGWYGASCKQTCHCAEGGDCNRFTGACSAGCVPGWKGLSCQIKDDA